MPKDDKKIEESKPSAPVIEKGKAKKPSSFDQKKWNSWSESAQQNYLNVIARSNKRTRKGD